MSTSTKAGVGSASPSSLIRTFQRRRLNRHFVTLWASSLRAVAPFLTVDLLTLRAISDVISIVASASTVEAASVGGLLAAFIAYVLPDIIRLASDDAFVISWRRLLQRKLPVVISLTVIAGVINAYAVHAVTTGGAFAAGLGEASCNQGCLCHRS